MYKIIASLLIIGATLCVSGCMSSGPAGFHYSGFTYSNTGLYNGFSGYDNNNITSYGSIKGGITFQ